jgi:peptide/nickel transport system permease protein
LAGTALVSALLVGALLGTWQAVREGSLRERLSSLFVSGLSAVPDVWLGLLLLLVFGAELALFPMGGRCDAVQCSSARGVAAVLDAMRHLALPVLTLTLVFATPFARMQRVAVRDVLHDDVMRTARAKGVTTAQQVLHHAVRRSAHPLIASVGLSLPVLAGGTVLVERVFGWPGMGALLVNAVAVRDYPLVTASAMVGALLVVGGALLTDTLSASLDPRWRGALA